MPDSVYQTLRSHYNVPRETFDKLSLYHDLVIKWQRSINLVSDSTLNELWQRHILDSVQLLPYMRKAGRVVDIGSGAGFPGLALSICGVQQIHLVESDAKKVAFLKEAARITQAEVSIHPIRVEEFILENVTHITSRALADLKKLLTLTRKIVSHGTICLFHKGKNWSNEIKDAKELYSFQYEIFPSVTDPEGVILKLSHISERSHGQQKPEQNRD